MPGMLGFEKRTKPMPGMLEVTGDILNEDPRWLQVEDIDDGEGNLVPTITIDEAIKTSVQDADAQNEFDQAQSDQLEAAIDQVVARYRFADRIKAHIAILNETKGWSVGQFKAYLKDRDVLEILNQLAAGAFETCVDTLSTADLSKYYTNAEVSDISDKLSNYLANE